MVRGFCLSLTSVSESEKALTSVTCPWLAGESPPGRPGIVPAPPDHQRLGAPAHPHGAHIRLVDLLPSIVSAGAVRALSFVFGRFRRVTLPILPPFTSGRRAQPVNESVQRPPFVQLDSP